MRRFETRELSTAGVIAAVYVVISYFLAPISFGVYQVRLAEALTVLPFLTRAAIPGLFIGCFLANIFGGNGWIDIIVGSLLTLVAAILTRSIYHFSRRVSSQILAILSIILLWTGSIYLLSEFTISFRLFGGAGMSGLAIVAAAAASGIYAKDKSLGMLGGGFAAAAGVGFILSVILLQTTSSPYMAIVGHLLALSTVVTAAVFWFLKAKGLPPNLIVAPLPPVLINAFGVAAYLAPIIGTGYWFTVQMIGVGQLVACFLVGIPLLLLLKKRRLFE